MPALEVTNLSKTFAGQVALDRVDLVVDEGSVHALVGQNGSGKSTLIKSLAGYHTPDPGGSASVHGRALDLGSANDAHDKGLRFVHQDLGLVQDLSVLENLMIGRTYPTAALGRIRWAKARRMATEILDQVGLGHLDVRAPLSELGAADRTRLAIARALPEGGDKIVLILDEPTAALPSQDVDRLFETIRQLIGAGHSIILVSHHLDEIFAIADTVSVLRDGKKVATLPIKGSDHEGLVRLIVGGELDLASTRDDVAVSSGDVVMRLAAIAGGWVKDVSLEIRRGEVVGIAGLSGSGRESVAALVTGRLEREGVVEVESQPIASARPKASLRAGIASVMGDRARFATFPTLTVRSNVTVGSVSRHMRFGRIRARSERNEVRTWIDELGVVTRGCDALMSSLSGGNQQKALVARALRLTPKVLVLDDPTAGIDVGARDQVHRILEQRVAGEMAVLLASTDSDELARLCDRVLIMQRGRVGRVLNRGVDLSAEAIDHAQVSVG
jgi:ribose transport system ATP-binding protein